MYNAFPGKFTPGLVGVCPGAGVCSPVEVVAAVAERAIVGVAVAVGAGV